jgi:hypothetical protein
MDGEINSAKRPCTRWGFTYEKVIQDVHENTKPEILVTSTKPFRRKGKAWERRCDRRLSEERVFD